MTSVVSSLRQVSPGGLYVNVAALAGAVSTEASVIAAAADPTYAAPLAAVSWSVAGAAGTVFLKDMGKTISGNGLTFRKVQRVGDDAATFGVSGSPADTDAFQTGYILLGSGSAVGSGYAIAAVAKSGL